MQWSGSPGPAAITAVVRALVPAVLNLPSLTPKTHKNKQKSTIVPLPRAGKP